VFAVYGAPVILSGTPTFAGYTSLPDTSHQMALADLFAHHGPDWASVPQSSRRISLSQYVTSSYPVGAQVALGVTAPLGAVDLAWLYQPFLAVIGVVLALALAGLLQPSGVSSRRRAAIAFVAAQPALLVSYSLQGSIKELAATALLATAVAAVAAVWRPRGSVRELVPLAVVGAAGFGALGPAVGPYLVALAIPVTIHWLPRLRARGVWRGELAWAPALVAIFVLLSLPMFQTVGTAVAANTATLDQTADLGNLAAPLSKLQAVGVWLNGDYRYAGSHQYANLALIGLVIAGVLLGAIWIARRRLLGPGLYLVVMLAVSAYLLRRGSPYADAKVLAMLGPAVLLAAMLGTWSLASAGRRIEGAALAALIALGVLASNALAYHDVSLAPYDRYRELLQVNHRLAGKGPALFNEYDEFAKYFLRDVPPTNMPESAMTFRLAPYHPNALVDPARRPSVKTPMDIDDTTNEYLQLMRYLIVRRSPLTSRPPANFRRIWSGRWYEIWAREPAPRVLEHIPLGPTLFEPASVPRCADVQSAARRAMRAGARLATVERPKIPYFITEAVPHPASWKGHAGYPGSLVPTGQGRVETDLTVPRDGHYRLWLEGSFGRRVHVRVDGREIGSVANRLNNAGAYEAIGEVSLRRGRHRIAIFQNGGTLAPGSGGFAASLRHIGPLALSLPENEARSLTTVDASQWRSLCGRSLDWIEIVR
jgi:hypothetical protein